MKTKYLIPFKGVSAGNRTLFQGEIRSGGSSWRVSVNSGGEGTDFFLKGTLVFVSIHRFSNHWTIFILPVQRKSIWPKWPRIKTTRKIREQKRANCAKMSWQTSLFKKWDAGKLPLQQSVCPTLLQHLLLILKKSMNEQPIAVKPKLLFNLPHICCKGIFSSFLVPRSWQSQTYNTVANLTHTNALLSTG